MLSRPVNLFKLQQMENSSDMEADILKQEFGTTGNTLSFWKCDNLDSVIDAVKAIILSTTAIKPSQFVIVEESVATRYGFSMDDKNPGVTGYNGFESLHVDMINLTYGKIGTLMQMLKEVASDENYSPKYERNNVKELIKEVIDAGCLNKETTPDALLKDIYKYFPETKQ